MSLHCAASNEYIGHGNASSVNNLDGVTIIFWSLPQAIANTNRRIVWKGGLLICECQSQFSQDGQFRFFRGRDTTHTEVRTQANFFAVGTWKFYAVTDGDGVTPHIYGGDLSTAVAEIGSYHAQTTGSGSPLDDSADSLLIGSRDVGNAYSDHEIGAFWLYNRRLTLGEIAQHQFQWSTILPGCVLHSKYGFQGTGTVVDYSGNGNSGTLNGTPDLTPNPPLGPAFWSGGSSEVAAPPVVGPSAGLRTLALTGAGI